MFAVIGTQYFKELNYLRSVLRLLSEERVHSRASQRKKPKISSLLYDSFLLGVLILKKLVCQENETVWRHFDG